MNKKISLKFIKPDIGFYVQKKAIKLLVKTLKFAYKSTKQEIIKYMQKEYLTKKGFYIRRVYFEFFNEIITIFSIKFTEAYGILSCFYPFINDGNLDIRIKSIKLLEKLVPFATDESVNIIIEKVEECRKNNTVFNYECNKSNELVEVPITVFKSNELENVYILFIKGDKCFL